MAIIRPEQMDFSGQKFSAIIYGAPGVGKTTLALSSPNPVLIDFDHGVSRVQAQHRAPTIMCANYEEVQGDIHSKEINSFETVVIDTGGSFVTFLKDWAFRTKQDARTKSGEFNNMKGFCYVKSEFSTFADYVKTVLNKNVIFIFHSTEEKDKDGSVTQRLMCEGSARNTVWNSCDFGGYVQMIGRERKICFTPTQEYFAKGTHGIVGEISIPELTPGVPNDFMTKLFAKARKSIVAENEANKQAIAKYEEVLATVREMLEQVTDVQTANLAAKNIPTLEHVLTSKRESSVLLKNKAKELGLVYDKERGCYAAPEDAMGEA